MLDQAPFVPDQAHRGDAAAAVDPLVGSGGNRGRRGGLALAPRVDTLLRRPDNAAHPLRFQREPVAETSWPMARTGRKFHAAERRLAGRPGVPESQLAGAVPGSTQHLSAWRTDTTPVSIDGLIEPRPPVRGVDRPRRVWQVAGGALAPMLAAGDDGYGARKQDPRVALARALRPGRALSGRPRWRAEPHRGLVRAPIAAVAGGLIGAANPPPPGRSD